MTPPVLEAADIPFQSAQAIQAENDPQHAINSYLLSERRIRIFCVTPVSMGNPHAVMFVDNIFDTDVEAIGRQLTKHPAYPSGTNVEFCQIVDRQFMRLRVFERGVGETQACGSGACAAAVVARLKNLIDPRGEGFPTGWQTSNFMVRPQYTANNDGQCNFGFFRRINSITLLRQHHANQTMPTLLAPINNLSLTIFVRIRNFFVRHPSILAELTLPHDSGQAVSLGRAADDHYA